MTGRVALAVFAILCACHAELVRPTNESTVYRRASRGMIDLFCSNPHAHRCSAWTHDFRDAYALDDQVQAIAAVDVSGDASRVVLHTTETTVSATDIVNDGNRIRAFWRTPEWTLAIALDHRCTNDRCAAEVSLIRYQGDRAARTCFERWAGMFTRIRGAR